MTNSESLKNLVPALLKAQGEMGKAVKGAENPFFHSDYADLTSVMEVVKEPLNANGLAILQSVDTEVVRTTLLHTSGEWLQSGGTRIVSAKPNDPQAQGSAITYAKRYDLQALLFVPTTDDDGEKAVDREAPLPKALRDKRPRVEEPQDHLDFTESATGGAITVTKTKKTTPEERHFDAPPPTWREREASANQKIAVDKRLRGLGYEPNPDVYDSLKAGMASDFIGNKVKDTELAKALGISVA